jgi:hypothetical protein
MIIFIFTFLTTHNLPYAVAEGIFNVRAKDVPSTQLLSIPCTEPLHWFVQMKPVSLFGPSTKLQRP